MGGVFLFELNGWGIQLKRFTFALAVVVMGLPLLGCTSKQSSELDGMAKVSCQSIVGSWTYWADLSPSLKASQVGETARQGFLERLEIAHDSAIELFGPSKVVELDQQADSAKDYSSAQILSGMAVLNSYLSLMTDSELSEWGPGTNSSIDMVYNSKVATRCLEAIGEIPSQKSNSEGDSPTTASTWPPAEFDEVFGDVAMRVAQGHFMDCVGCGGLSYEVTTSKVCEFGVKVVANFVDPNGNTYDTSVDVTDRITPGDVQIVELFSFKDIEGGGIMIESVDCVN